MAGDWIKVEKCTPRKPEILEMAGMLGISPDEVFGKCFRIWAWADDHTESGNARGVTPALLDDTMGVTGFAKALAAVGWVEILEKSDSLPRGGVAFVNFARHNGQTAKKRAVTAKRVAKKRETDTKQCNAASVTEALPREEKNREENKDSLSTSNGSATKPPPPEPTAREREDFEIINENGFGSVPPTFAQVAAYARSINYAMDVQDFLDWHEARGWTLKGTKLKDWRPQVRGAKTDFMFKPKRVRTSGPPKRDNELERNMVRTRILKEMKTRQIPIESDEQIEELVTKEMGAPA